MTAPQQVWRTGGRESEGEKEKKRGGAILMMSSSPWEEEETYAASRGAGACLSMHTLGALDLRTHCVN